MKNMKECLFSCQEFKR